jgi:hypothetical protein
MLWIDAYTHQWRWCHVFRSRLATRNFTAKAYVWIYDRYRVVDMPVHSVFTWVVGAVTFDFFYYWFHRANHGECTTPLHLNGPWWKYVQFSSERSSVQHCIVYLKLSSYQRLSVLVLLVSQHLQFQFLATVLKNWNTVQNLNFPKKDDSITKIVTYLLARRNTQRSTSCGQHIRFTTAPRNSHLALRCVWARFRTSPW